jgi:hypothetical protein
LRFGKLRGLAQYDAAELYREFKHLRHAIWRLLREESAWTRGDVFEVMLAVDQYLDEVIGASLRGFFEATGRTSGANGRASDELARMSGEQPRPADHGKASSEAHLDPADLDESGPGQPW